jgi:hypothetical protein
VRRQLKFHRDQAGAWQHPREPGTTGVAAFLNHLANEEPVAAATQNQALKAVFPHRRGSIREIRAISQTSIALAAEGGESPAPGAGNRKAGEDACPILRICVHLCPSVVEQFPESDFAAFCVFSWRLFPWLHPWNPRDPW